MLNLITQNYKLIFAGLLGTAVLFISFFSAINAGKVKAQNQVLLSNAKELTLGLSYFYQDNDRYPTLFEYSDVDGGVMQTYFDFYPVKDIVTQNCTKSFDYKPQGTESYILNLCLPEESENFKQGWNKLLPDSF